MFSLEPEVIERLKPAFGPSTAATGDFWKLIPHETNSLTIYHQNDLFERMDRSQLGCIIQARCRFGRCLRIDLAIRAGRLRYR